MFLYLFGVLYTVVLHLVMLILCFLIMVLHLSVVL